MGTYANLYNLDRVKFLVLKFRLTSFLIWSFLLGSWMQIGKDLFGVGPWLWPKNTSVVSSNKHKDNLIMKKIPIMDMVEHHVPGSRVLRIEAHSTRLKRIGVKDDHIIWIVRSSLAWGHLNHRLLFCFNTQTNLWFILRILPLILDDITIFLRKEPIQLTRN